MNRLRYLHVVTIFYHCVCHEAKCYAWKFSDHCMQWFKVINFHQVQNVSKFVCEKGTFLQIQLHNYSAAFFCKCSRILSRTQSL